MRVPGMSAFNFNSGVRMAWPRMLLRAAATSSAVGSRRPGVFTLAAASELNDLSDATGARLLEYVIRGGEVLRRYSQGFVERHVGRRLTSRLGAIRNLADLGQDVIRR